MLSSLLFLIINQNNSFKPSENNDYTSKNLDKKIKEAVQSQLTKNIIHNKGKRSEIRLKQTPKSVAKNYAPGAAVPGQIANTPLNSYSKDFKNKQFDFTFKNTAQTPESRGQMTPGVVESFNPKSDLIANTPCVEEYFISKTSSQQQNFESPINEQELLLSSQKKEQQSVTELKESVNEIESDSSDEDDEDEDYEEEFKGNILDRLVSIDIVPSPEHVPQFYNQNKKQYFEDEVIDPQRKSDDYSNEGII